MTPDTPGSHIRDVSPKPAYPPGEAIERTFTDDQLAWTAAETAAIDVYRAQYPTADGPVMKVLWLAQRKLGWLPPEAVQHVAQTLGLPYAKVYGVATFYTQYFKKEVGKVVLDVCCCFTCQICGGYDMLHHIEKRLGIKKGETTADGMFTVQEAECLGACGTAPMLQVTNGPYVHNLTTAKVDALLDSLRAGNAVPFESVTLPQDQDDLGGNRRTDAEAVEGSVVPPVSATVH